MTAITTAARLLRVAADELKNAHTLGGDWGNEHEALDAYNEHMATATTLEHMARQCLQQIEEPAGAAPAAVAPQGEYPPLPSNIAHVTRRIRRCESEPTAQIVLEHAMHAYFDLGRQAAPALEAPAAPARIVADALIRLDAIYREEADCDEPPQRPDWLVNALHLAAAAPQAPAAPEDPMDWPLPCDVTVGHGTIRKGCKLRTLVLRMQVLYQLAQETELAAPAAPSGTDELECVCGASWERHGHCDYEMVHTPRKAAPAAPAVDTPARPELTVVYQAMPESNGKRNWTVLLRRKDVTGLGGGDIANGICFYRGEYHGHGAYHADRLRFLIGEISQRPDILAYDSESKEPAAAQAKEGGA